ncbi:MAG: DUF2071 domain-containing protein [Chitinophagaceae bacterium]|nr:MAG: DUF2071 domain-containing protein [Chitinophagaceae bacterium]
MKTFLTAEWKNLVFANYKVDPDVLRAYLPMGAEIDFYEGDCFVSLVGFMFLNTAVKGIRYPFHTNFEEFNLRFYVRFPDGDGWKRGVVFVREIVPRRMITQVARVLYGERYYYHPMKNSLAVSDKEINVKYEFLYRKKWNHIAVTASSTGAELQPGSQTEFITEHYWGYTRRGPGLTSEYKVQHPSWKIHGVTSYSIDCDTLNLYGPDLHRFLINEPDSVFLAAGSAVSVHQRVLHRYNP